MLLRAMVVATKILRDLLIAIMIHLAISCAICVATKLRDNLRDKLHSVTTPLLCLTPNDFTRQGETVLPIKESRAIKVYTI
jgi:hypothetical protein